jgi:hypothetical protein
MKMFNITVGVTALLVLALSGPAFAVQSADQPDLLAEFSEPGITAAAMSAMELGEVRGEGTMIHSFDFPELGRDFNHTFSYDATTISIVGTAGVGVTITIDSPFVD